MIACPHCGNSIDVGPTKVAWWRYERGGPVSLGCGTLILIAIIVSFFSRGSDDSDAIRELRNDIQALERKIDQLNQGEDRPAIKENRTAEKDLFEN